jgi:predicted MFS family arabinose efflux permease
MATLAEAIPRQALNRALIVGASTLGTVFEWYDFFLYGALATFIAAHFFSGVNETTGFMFALGGFAVGFLVRPLGALIFGRIGDRVGRKTTFLVTLTLMGLATVLIGLVPGYDAIGIAAPLILLGLRIVQGLAVGGEFAGAITYVAEHAPQGKSGFHTSFIGLSALSGLLVSLLVIAAVRVATGAEDFAEWGWRVPFLLSAPLLFISLWIRLKLGESPVFRRLKESGQTSTAPLVESFLRRENLKRVLVVTVAMAGQAVVFYTTTFYVFFFLQKTAKLDTFQASIIHAVALGFGCLFALGAGWLSDKVGRKPLILAAYAAATLLFFPLFGALFSAANPAMSHAQASVPIVVHAESGTCSFQFDPVGKNSFETTSCDIALSFLAGAGVNYRVRAEHAAKATQIRIGRQSIMAPAPETLSAPERKAAILAFRADAKAMLESSGYRDIVDTASIIALLLVINALTVPVLVTTAEIFPASIRYSSLALPQNVGNGWFGGFLPITAFAIVAATGNIYAGLWYPVAITGAAFVICLLFLPETRGRSL